MIRQINVKDIRQVAGIWLKISLDDYSFVCEHSGISPREFWSDKLPEMIQTTLEADGYVYQIQDQIQGFITMRPETSCGYYVYELFIDSPWQGKGIGETLINHAKSLGTYIRTSAYEKAARAIGFYEKHGFVKESETPRIESTTKQRKFDFLWKKG